MLRSYLAEGEVMRHPYPDDQSESEFTSANVHRIGPVQPLFFNFATQGEEAGKKQEQTELNKKTNKQNV